MQNNSIRWSQYTPSTSLPLISCSLLEGLFEDGQGGRLVAVRAAGKLRLLSSSMHHQPSIYLAAVSPSPGNHPFGKMAIRFGAHSACCPGMDSRNA